MEDSMKLALEALKDAREVLDLGGARHVLGTDKAMALVARVDQAIAALSAPEEPKTWREFMDSAPRFGQRQDSTVEQLADLRAVANKLGFYDAADALKTQLPAQREAPVAEGEAVASFVPFEKFSDAYDKWCENHSPEKDGWDGTKRALFDILKESRDA
jgi:hypothetical protein